MIAMYNFAQDLRRWKRTWCPQLLFCFVCSVCACVCVCVRACVCVCASDNSRQMNQTSVDLCIRHCSVHRIRHISRLACVARQKACYEVTRGFRSKGGYAMSIIHFQTLVEEITKYLMQSVKAHIYVLPFVCLCFVVCVCACVLADTRS